MIHFIVTVATAAWYLGTGPFLGYGWRTVAWPVFLAVLFGTVGDEGPAIFVLEAAFTLAILHSARAAFKRRELPGRV